MTFLKFRNLSQLKIIQKLMLIQPERNIIFWSSLFREELDEDAGFEEQECGLCTVSEKPPWQLPFLMPKPSAAVHIASPERR